MPLPWNLSASRNIYPWMYSTHDEVASSFPTKKKLLLDEESTFFLFPALCFFFLTFFAWPSKAKNPHNTTRITRMETSFLTHTLTIVVILDQLVFYTLHRCSGEKNIATKLKRLYENEYLSLKSTQINLEKDQEKYKIWHENVTSNFGQCFERRIERKVTKTK